FPLSWMPAYETSPFLQDWRTYLSSAIDKTHEGPLRFAHFLCLAYLVSLAAGPGGNRLHGHLAHLTQMVGRQSLACFMTGLALSFAAGVV
ncbi:OpgC domain-containing protein, partial [Acinetobacter baumannii]